VKERKKGIYVRLYPPVDKELRWLKAYFKMSSVSDPEFIRWLIHKTFQSIVMKDHEVQKYR